MICSAEKFADMGHIPKSRWLHGQVRGDDLDALCARPQYISGKAAMMLIDANYKAEPPLGMCGVIVDNSAPHKSKGTTSRMRWVKIMREL